MCICVYGILYVGMYVCVFVVVVFAFALCDFLVVNSCQTHKGETTLKGFVVTSTYSRAAVAGAAAHSLAQ